MSLYEKNKKKYRLAIAICFLVLIGLALLSFTLGRYPLTLKDIFQVLFRFFKGEVYWKYPAEHLLLKIRLPRIVLGMMVGACLSAAGASYQGIFQNPMASPDILGASSGAAFGAALAILKGGSYRHITLSAFFFSLLTVALVWTISRKTRGRKILGLILTGIMVSSLFSAGTSFIKLVADPYDELPAITYWLMGSLSGSTLEDVQFAFIPMVLGIIPLLLFRWRMNLLTLGDDEAQTLGVNTNTLRFIVIISATLITSASVAVSGTIGWVGLVIPHMARRIVGNNYRFLLPMTLTLGALFMLVVDNVSRNLFANEIPLGILTAFIGAPFFLYLITKGAKQ